MPATTIQIRAQDKTKQAFSAVQRSVSGLSKSFGSLKGSIAGLLGVAALGGLSKSLLTTADRIDKVSQQTGVATGDLQKFQFAASQSGVSTEGLNKSLQTLAKRAGEAQAEGGEMKAAFDRLNISLQNADGTSKNVTDLFYESAKAISLLESDTAKAAAANDLFGRSGVELLPLLNQGEAGVRKYGSSLEKAGGIMSDKFVKGAAKTNDAIDKTTRVLKVGFTNVLEALLPTIQGFAKTLSKFSRDFKAFSETHPTVTKLALAVTALAIAFAALGGPLTAIVAGVVLLITNWEKLTSLFEGFDSKVKKMGLKQLREEQDRLNKSVKNLEVPWFLKGSASEEVLLKKQSVKLKEQLKIIEKQIKALETKEKLVEETNKTLEDTNKLTKDTVKLRGWLRPLQEDSLDLYEKERGQAEFILAEKKAGLLTTEKQNKLYGAGLDEQFKKHGEITEELKKQRAESARITGIVLSGIQSSGAAAARFFDALNIQIKQVGDSFTLAFETNWVAIVAKLVMSSKIVSGFINKLFSGVGNAIDKTIGKIFPFLTETEETFDSVDLRLKDIANMVDQLNDAQFGYMNTLRHLTDDARALVIIERDYQKNKKEAKRLNSGYLSHLADQNNMLAKMAHHISSMRRATDAFKSSVISYIDALEQSGFTNLQKELSMTLKGFIRGPLQNFNKLITESKEVSTTAKPALVEALEQETSLKALGKITDPGELITVLKGDEYLKDVFSEQLMAWEKMQSGDLSLVALGQNVEIFKKFGEVLNKELGKLGGDDGIIDVLTKSVSDASSTITTNTDLLNQASGGLTVMLKDSLKADFEAGKSKLDLVTDITAVASLLEDAGLNIKTFTDYIETLTPPDATGSMGGLFKKYPYGGKIYGPGHSGGGVNANLEGGEFVMSRSAVNKYGSDFMSSINNGSLGGQVQVNIYDGTGERISEFDSALRIEINDRAGRFNEFPALAV